MASRKLTDWNDIDGAPACVGAVVVLGVDEMEPCPTQPPTSFYKETVAEYLVDPALRHRNPLKVYLRDDRWYIRDGRHRWLAMCRAGVTECECFVVDGPSRPWNQPQKFPLRWWHDDPPG